VSDDEARSKRAFDLEERTARFGESVIAFVRAIDKNAVTRPVVGQLIRSATSVGANYCEADEAESKRDFRHKIALCRKESHEVLHWLRMMSAAEPSARHQARLLWQEAKELNLIFGAILQGKKKQ